MNATIRCSNPQCRVATSGKCVEGLPTTECPHFGKETAVEPTDKALTPSIESQTETEVVQGDLPSGNLLGPQQANALLCDRLYRVIAFIGANDAGKTTLLAALYERFQTGAFEGYSCRWSDTLHGFEIACHHSRMVSQREVPFTERTNLGSGLQYYQISILGEDGDLNLLLADRAGEFYRKAASDPLAVVGFDELRRADTLCFLVNGEKLADIDDRHIAKRELEMMMQGIVDSDALGRVRRAAIVLTKLDVLRSSPRALAAETEFDQLVDKLRDRFATSFSDCRSFKVAVSPAKDTAFERGHGLAELFQFWKETASPAFQPQPVNRPNRIFQNLRMHHENAQ